MENSLTVSSLAALLGAMVVLAAIPSVSVVVVSARSAAAGFRHGVFTTIGIVAGDIVFILLAIGGLAVLAQTMSSLFILIKYLGGAYLIWWGVTLWRSKPDPVEVEGGIEEASLLSSFLTGLLITLGDLKAILFYLGFFPAFLDLTAVSSLDIGIIIGVTILAVGGVKLGYAFLADRTRLLLKRSGAKKSINIAAGSVMIGVGIFLMVRS